MGQHLEARHVSQLSHCKFFCTVLCLSPGMALTDPNALRQ